MSDTESGSKEKGIFEQPIKVVNLFIYIFPGEPWKDVKLEDEKKEDKAGDSSEIKTDLPYPKSIFFIVSNEFCERFSYYGMRSKYFNNSYQVAEAPVLHVGDVFSHLVPVLERGPRVHGDDRGHHLPCLRRPLLLHTVIR